MTDRERLAKWSEEQARHCRALYGPQTVGAEWARNHEAIAALLREQTDELRQRILVQSGMAGGDLAVLPMVAKVLIGDVPQKAAETEPAISEPEGEEVAAFTAQDMARWLEEKADLGRDDHWHTPDCPTCARYQRAAALLQEREPDGEIHQPTFKAVVQFYRGFEERLTDLAEAVWRATAEPKCGRCGHPQGWHRHDDTTESDAFRCIGYDCWAPGPPKDPCGCPDYVEPRAPASTSEPAAPTQKGATHD